MSPRYARFSLRPVRPEDLGAVMELERYGFDPDIRESRDVFERRLSLFPDGFLLLVDEASGAAAGYYCAERWPSVPAPSAEAYELGGDPSGRCASDGPVLYTASMTVSPAYRGTGAGAHLFRASRQRILAAFPALTRELLVVRSVWTSARRVYAAAGFREQAVLRAFFAPGEEGAGIVMEK